MFYKRDSATFKRLNCLDRISLMSYKSKYNCRGTDVFLMLLSCYSLYIIPPWSDIGQYVYYSCNCFLTKNSRQKSKYLEKEKSFCVEIKGILLSFLKGFH